MWIYKDKEFTSPENKHAGFVYIITNEKNGKKYIGKKLFFTKRGKKLVHSNWNNYFGSSKQLLADVEKYGKENFTRTIIRLCTTKLEMSFVEAKLQFDNDVLFDDDFYNGIIHCRIRASKSLHDAIKGT